VFPGEHGAVLLPHGSLGYAERTMFFMRLVTSWLVLFPLRKRVCLTPSTSLGSLFLILRMALMDFGLSYMAFNNDYYEKYNQFNTELERCSFLSTDYPLYVLCFDIFLLGRR
jgi:hypothetical protein